MAVYFLDASAIVKRYVTEVGSPWIIGLSDPAVGHLCWLADITGVEVLAALYRRARIGSLTLSEARQLHAVFRHEQGTLFQHIATTAATLTRAMQLVATYPLRAYDAIQLAAALKLQDERLAQGLSAAILVSADQDLNRAASAAGLIVDDPNQHP